MHVEDRGFLKGDTAKYVVANASELLQFPSTCVQKAMEIGKALYLLKTDYVWAGLEDMKNNPGLSVPPI